MFAVISQQVFGKTRIQELLCSAFEGGSNYWIDEWTYDCGEHTLEDFRGGGKFTDPEEYWPPYLLIPFEDGCAVIIKDDEGNEHRLDKASIEEGLKKMAAWDVKHHWQNFINENEDAETGDVFLQFCLFGEVIYS